MVKELAYLSDGSEVYIPDRKITVDRHYYNLVPVRGYCASLAVFDLDDVCIGWMPIEITGYQTVKDWMRAMRWIDFSEK